MRRTLALAALTGLLAACGGGDGRSSATPPAPARSPAPTPPPAAQRPVRVQVDSALAGGESFQFTLGAQTTTVSATNTPVAGVPRGPVGSQVTLRNKGATGTTPIGAEALKVGCEWNHDLLSRSTTDTLGTAVESWKPTIGGDASTYGEGRFVAFSSSATGLSPNGHRQVFWRDRMTGVTHLISTDATGVERVSVTGTGAQANAGSHTARVSGNGRIVVFATDASKLMNGGSGTAVGGQRPSISADGNRIAFWSYASDITSGDGNGLWDIFVYQHDNATRRRISLRADGGERNQGTDSVSGVQQPVISGNGRFVVYPTSSSNVVAGDTNGAIDLFLVDLDGNEGVTRISVSSSGAQSAFDSGTGSYWDYTTMSHDGSWIAFASRATNFGTTVGSGLNLFLRNRGTGQVRALTDSTVDVGEVAFTASANYLAFSSGLQLDGRFASTGLFAHFTGLGRAFFWVD